MLGNSAFLSSDRKPQKCLVCRPLLSWSCFPTHALREAGNESFCIHTSKPLKVSYLEHRLGCQLLLVSFWLQRISLSNQASMEQRRTFHQPLIQMSDESQPSEGCHCWNSAWVRGMCHSVGTGRYSCRPPRVSTLLISRRGLGDSSQMCERNTPFFLSPLWCPPGRGKKQTENYLHPLFLSLISVQRNMSALDNSKKKLHPCTSSTGHMTHTLS